MHVCTDTFIVSEGGGEMIFMSQGKITAKKPQTSTHDFAVTSFSIMFIEQLFKCAEY